MLREIVHAIQNKETFTFVYDGFKRTVEPHTVGYSKDHNLIMRAFQTGGHSSSGKMGWKLYSLSGIEDQILFREAAVAETPRPGFKAGDSAMLHIVAEVSA